jgi:hypothetical protein
VIRRRDPGPAVAAPALVKAPGLHPTSSELRAARLLYMQGNEVVLRRPAGSASGGGASDLLVNGRRWDVFTPTTKCPDRIVSALAARHSRTRVEGVVVDLSQTCVEAVELADLESRLGGLGAVAGRVVVMS